MLLLVSGAVSVAFTADQALANAALELTSGASDLIVQDNSPGLDLNLASGQIIWAGTINGWTFSVTVGDTKPFLGSATSPHMDLSVTANAPGNNPLVVKFTDTDFGPTSGSINSSFFQNGTSTATTQVLIDPNNAQFGGLPAGNANLTGPYSITLVDNFSVGTVSADHRLTVPGTIPDGGMTVALLGFSVLGLAGLRRKLTA
jgi:hypothetical protein